MSAENRPAKDLCLCHGGRMNRFVQPCLLLTLYEGPSYGYELIEKLSKFNFYDKEPDTAAVYRQLRKLEQEGYVESKWQAGDVGPAKKYYKLTSEGIELLHYWAEEIRRRKKALENFLECYNEHFGEDKI